MSRWGQGETSKPPIELVEQPLPLGTGPSRWLGEGPSPWFVMALAIFLVTGPPFLPQGFGIVLAHGPLGLVVVLRCPGITSVFNACLTLAKVGITAAT